LASSSIAMRASRNHISATQTPRVGTEALALIRQGRIELVGVATGLSSSVGGPTFVGFLMGLLIVTGSSDTTGVSLPSHGGRSCCTLSADGAAIMAGAGATAGATDGGAAATDAVATDEDAGATNAGAAAGPGPADAGAIDMGASRAVVDAGGTAGLVAESACALLDSASAAMARTLGEAVLSLPRAGAAGILGAATIAPAAERRVPRAAGRTG